MPTTLTSNTFLDALQGLRVKDNMGKNINFLTSNNEVIIDDLHVKEDVFIQGNLKFPYPIEIRKCKFLKEFLIDGNTFRCQFKINGTSFNSDLILNNTIFEKEFLFSGGHISNDFIIDKGTSFNSNFEISGGSFGQKDKHSLNIKEAVFEKEFIISGGNFPGNIAIETTSSFNSKFTISNGRFGSKGLTENKITIKNGKFPNGFFISGGNFETALEIEFEGEQSINISGGIFKNSVNIFSANPVKPKYDSRNQSPSLNISGGEFFSNLKVFQGEFLDLGFSGGEFHADCEFTSIVIHNRMGIGSTKFNSKLILNDGEIREIEFYLEKIDFEVLIDCHFVGLLKFDTVIESSGSVLIKKLALNQLYIKDLINYGRFIIQGLKYFEHPYVINYGERNAITNLSGDFPDEKQFESRIHFENSSLGELLFINVDFSSFNEIISENSKVGNISTYGGHFPTKKKHSFLLKNGVLKDEKEEKPDFNLAEQNSEFYNQLYLAMQKQGHRAKEMDYYAEYMEWHRLFLKQEKKEINTRVSLCLNKWSSNYGQDWIRSALITLFIGWLFYFLYIISLPVVTICPTKFNWPDFWFFFGEYWSFLNPVHKVDFIEGLKPGPASKTWDFAGRIFISILIYQTVTAFRRFGRK